MTATDIRQRTAVLFIAVMLGHILLISAQVQSLARALAATTDPGLSLTTVKGGLERILPEIVRTTSRS